MWCLGRAQAHDRGLLHHTARPCIEGVDIRADGFHRLGVLFDEQAAQLVGTVDDLGERVRKNDEYTLTSIGSVTKNTRIKDQDDVTLSADAMVKELRDDNKTLHKRLGEVKEAAEEAGDNATSGVVDDWIDECEERIWFLNQTSK